MVTSESNSPQGSAETKKALSFSTSTFLKIVPIGIVAGILAGLFGVGGGLIMVPALVWVGMAQKEAVATSLAAIIPISLSGSITYSLGGEMNWPVALCMSVGMVLGAQVGSWLLSRIPNRALSWIFTIFLVVMIIQQFLVLPERGAIIIFTPLMGLMLFIAGVLTGALAGILGVGGGGLLVPELIVFFGAGDLLARGISVFAMLPGAISGTTTNVKRRLVNLIPALLLGLIAACLTPFGKMLATAATPQLNQYLFAGFLFFVLARSTWSSLRSKSHN